MPIFYSNLKYEIEIITWNTQSVQLRRIMRCLLLSASSFCSFAWFSVRAVCLCSRTSGLHFACCCLPTRCRWACFDSAASARCCCVSGLQCCQLFSLPGIFCHLESRTSRITTWPFAPCLLCLQSKTGYSAVQGRYSIGQNEGFQTCVTLSRHWAVCLPVLQ